MRFFGFLGFSGYFVKYCNTVRWWLRYPVYT